MNSAFGEVFMFLTNLAWKSRLTIPVLLTTAFLIMDIRFQIEINIQSGHMGPGEFNDVDNGDDDYIENDDDEDYNYEEYTTDSSAEAYDEDDDENGNTW